MQKQKLTFSLFSELTRFEFALFGLPFILAGAILPFALFPDEVSLTWRWLWLIPAFFTARLSGMAFNQLIDRKIDKANPRTAGRAIPSGRATPWQARLIAWLFLILFLLICAQIHPICFALSPLVALLIYTYSYLKRVTMLCHFILGSIHFLGPVMASLAIGGHWSLSSLLLGITAALSIAGNDMVYAFQDYHFDKANALHSAPARLGLRRSLQLAQLSHIGCLLSFILLGVLSPLRPLFFIGPLLAALALIDFHAKVKPLIERPEEAHRVDPLFFKNNVTIAFIALFSVILGIPWKG